MQLGAGYFSNLGKKMFQQFAERYNGLKTEFQGLQSYNRASETVVDGYNFTVDLQEYQLRLAEDGKAMHFVQKYKATSLQKDMNQMPKAWFDGEVTVTVSLKEQPVDRGSISLQGPKLGIKMTSSDCQGKYCAMIQKLESIVFPIDQSDFFDRPSAARLLTGLIQGFNEFTAGVASSTFASFDAKKQVINVALNCQQDHINRMLRKPLGEKDADIQLGQNILQLFSSLGTEYDLKRIYSVLKEFYINDEIPLTNIMKQYGFGNLQGKLTLESDPAILDQLDLSKFAPNGIEVTPKVKSDDLGLQMMDAVNMTFTIFARLTESANDDIVILPI